MLRQVSDPIKAMLTCDMRESRTKVIKIDGFSCEVGVQILWTCFRGRWSNQNRARRPGSRRGPVGRSTPGIYCRLIQLCRAAMGAMCGCCGEAPPAAPSRAPGLPFSFFSFVRLWAPVPLRAPPAGVVWAASASWASWASSWAWSRGARPPAGVVWGSIAPQTVAGRADGVVVFATGSLGRQACSIFQCSSVEISPAGIHSFCVCATFQDCPFFGACPRSHDNILLPTRP